MMNGAKELFAVEYEVTESRMGYVRLWIENQPVGSWEETYILPVAIALNRLVDYSEYLELDIAVNSASKVFEFILANEEYLTGTLLGFGESFESFEIRAYLFKGYVVFIWKILPIQADEQIFQEYNIFDIQAAQIDKKLYHEVVDEFKFSIEKSS